MKVFELTTHPGIFYNISRYLVSEWLFPSSAVLTSLGKNLVLRLCDYSNQLIDLLNHYQNFVHRYPTGNTSVGGEDQHSGIFLLDGAGESLKLLKNEFDYLYSIDCPRKFCPYGVSAIC